MDPNYQDYYQQGYYPPQGSPCGNAQASPGLPTAPGQQQPGYYYSQPQQPYGAYPYMYSMQEESARNKATAAMILGILSFFLVPIVLGIVSLVMGNDAKKVLAPGAPGHSQAQAGVILGIINLCVYGLAIVFSVLSVLMAFSFIW